MNYIQHINEIKLLQENLAAIQKNISSRIKNLKKIFDEFIQKKLSEEFSGWKFSWSNTLEFGSMFNTWKPSIYFNSVNNCQLSKKGHWWKYGEGKVKPPILTKRFLDFLKKLSEDIGVRCYMRRQEPFNSKFDYVLKSSHLEDQE